MNNQFEIIKNLFSNFWWRLNNLYYIADESGNTIRFKPNTIQRKILEERSGYRDIILKYRQGGVSTLFIILLLDDTLFGGKNRNNFFVTHKQELLNEFFSKARFIYESIPEPYKKILPKPTTDNANELRFAKTPDGQILNNSLKITLDVRGKTATNIHVSEFAWRDIEKQRKLKLAMDELRKANITIETTANGVGDVFYNMVSQAKNGNGTYKLLFYPWYIEERNRLKIENKELFILSKEERKLKELYNLDDEQIYWRRKKIQDADSLGQNGEQLFNQENPTTIESAFISSGSSVFNLSTNFNIIKEYKKWNGWKLFKKPQDGLYIGVDIAEGGVKGDFSAISVRNYKGELVATYKEKVNEVILAKKINDFFEYTEDGKKYLGIVVPENNIGLAFIKEIQKFDWFSQRVPLMKKNDGKLWEDKQLTKYGIRTDKKTKPLMIANYKKQLTDIDENGNKKESIEISEEIKAEIFTYEYDKNNKPNAIAPNHDDLLMADMIANYAIELYPEYLITYKKENTSFFRKSGNGFYVNLNFNNNLNNKEKSIIGYTEEIIL